jgi:hypothetical protein
MARENKPESPKRAGKSGGPVAKPKAKASTSYSPAPMSDAAKRKASRAGAEKARQYKDLPARLPSPNPARTSYSPQTMTAYDKAKAAARGKATAAKTKNPQGLKQMNFDKKAKSKSTASKVGAVAGKVAKRVKTVAREVRDVKTAFGTSLRDQEQNVRRAAMGVGPTGKNVGKNLRTQIKEVVSAAKSGKKGTASDTYNRPGAYNKGTKRK